MLVGMTLSPEIIFFSNLISQIYPKVEEKIMERINLGAFWVHEKAGGFILVNFLLLY